MSEPSPHTARVALNIAVLTVSDTRTEATDGSGQVLIDALRREEHRLAARTIVPDDKYRIRATVSAWIADDTVDVVLISGGTGLTGRDGTPEAVRPLLDKEIEGFGELFRQLSHHEIGASALLSRALAGIANGTAIFCIPGSPSACRTAWNGLLRDLLDSGVKPCNLATLRPRLRE
jgi:molybdenum cofactor biosynthesis protein B